MRVLQVSAEIFPLLKTGGLADVAGALPAALNAAGCETRVLLPGFPKIEVGLTGAVEVGHFAAPWGDTARLLFGRFESVGVEGYLIDAPALYGRPGNPYADAAGNAYGDNHRRFGLLGWAARALAHGLDPYWRPRIVHSHDWHAALANAYIAFDRGGASTVYTVHNLAYQGQFAPHHLGELGLPSASFGVDGLEFHGQISFMKAGLSYADRVTTVSPTYAREIQTAEQGCGLDGLLRNRSATLSGILNGVDDAVWNPATDPELTANYDARDLSPKARCKAALQKEFGLASEAKSPLFGVVSRLTEQKGLNLVLAAVGDLIDRGGQLVMLGDGDPALVAGFREAGQAHPGRVALRVGYDERLAHRIFGGTDFTLVPSRFEPCGLTQLYGLRYGSLPVVRRVGGLADTVVDTTLEEIAEGTSTGVVFDRFDAADLIRALRRAFALYRRPSDLATVRRHAMAQRFGWDTAARDYAALYRSLTGEA